MSSAMWCCVVSLSSVVPFVLVVVVVVVVMLTPLCLSLFLSNKILVDGFPRVVCAPRSDRRRGRRRPTSKKQRQTTNSWWFTLSEMFKKNQKRRPGSFRDVSSARRRVCRFRRVRPQSRFRRRPSRGCVVFDIAPISKTRSARREYYSYS